MGAGRRKPPRPRLTLRSQPIAVQGKSGRSAPLTSGKRLSRPQKVCRAAPRAWLAATVVCKAAFTSYTKIAAGGRFPRMVFGRPFKKMHDSEHQPGLMIVIDTFPALS